MGLLIDTSVFIHFERAGLPPGALSETLGSQPALLSAITASELLHGVHRANTAVRRGRREAWVEAVLARIPVLPFDTSAARVHARIWADLASQGTLIGAHDLLIAATALAGAHAVLTANIRDFRRIDGLELLPYPAS